MSGQPHGGRPIHDVGGVRIPSDTFIRKRWKPALAATIALLVVIGTVVAVTVASSSSSQRDRDATPEQELTSLPGKSLTPQIGNATSGKDPIEGDVSGLTNLVSQDQVETTAPTWAPTQAPTVSPTERPTAGPTAFPTKAPTPAPSIDSYQKWMDARVTKADGVMYEIVDQIPHDPGAFTQGLTYVNGGFYESTGLYGQSSVRVLDPQTGAVAKRVDLPGRFFGEGMTYHEGRLIQLTWKSRTGFIYNASDITQPSSSFRYRTTKNDEGWGITLNAEANELIVSDGSNNLIFWDPFTFQILRTVPVFRQDKSSAWNLNELEFWRERVVANVWKEEVLLVINPVTGVVEKEYDMSMLWPVQQRPSRTDVLNGISVSEDPNVLYVGGKRWNRMYKLKLLP